MMVSPRTHGVLLILSCIFGLFLGALVDAKLIGPLTDHYLPRRSSFVLGACFVIMGAVLLPTIFRWLVYARCLTPNCPGRLRCISLFPVEYHCGKCNRRDKGGPLFSIGYGRNDD